MKHSKKILMAGAFLLGQAVSGGVFAMSVTLAGNTVDYTFDDAMLGLFGPASLSGDVLSFTPVDFQAKSLNGAGYALANSTMNIQMTAHDGWMFSSVGLLEKGDYMLLGAGSTAAVGGQVRIHDVSAPLIDMTASIESSVPLDHTGLQTTNWTAQASADLSPWTTARTLNVTVQNLLLASSDTASSVAFVDKKFVGVNPGMTAVTPVPEAQTSALMLAGLGLIGWKIRWRRAVTQST
ncbi:PEP-CTERM sorting domain-containing protein [Thiobacillus sp.]